MPKISVVVPVYKVEPYLRRCVDSILAQTFEDFQLILVDDGSPDNCGAICDEYAEKDSRVHVIHRENGGLSAARNSGIDWVFDGHMTEWITFIDSDDWVRQDFLEILLNLAMTYQVNISVGHSQFAYDETVKIEEDSNTQIFSPEKFWVNEQGHATVAWLKLYKTNLFIGIRYPEGKLHEDEFTTYKVLFSQKKIVFSSDRIYYYYQSPNSIMRSEWNGKRLDAIEAYQEQMKFFKGRYPLAYQESRKLYLLSVINSLSEIKKSQNPKYNYTLFYNCMKNYLLQKYNSKFISSLCALYIKKLKLEYYIKAKTGALKSKLIKSR